MNTQKSETEKLNETPEKRNWENDNLENAGGIGADGGSKAYAT
ncbi:hypothetical protein [Aquirufa ecclesiirivi]|nr:hypothetical protein [Aquirufa ecclesiirivi]